VERLCRAEWRAPGAVSEILSDRARVDLFTFPGAQANHASTKIRTRIVVPLIPLSTLGRPIADLNPIVRHAFVAQSLATFTIPEMGECIGSSTTDHGVAFGFALDILTTGF